MKEVGQIFSIQKEKPSVVSFDKFKLSPPKFLKCKTKKEELLCISEKGSFKAQVINLKQENLALYKLNRQILLNKKYGHFSLTKKSGKIFNNNKELTKEYFSYYKLNSTAHPVLLSFVDIVISEDKVLTIGQDIFDFSAEFLMSLEDLENKLIDQI